MSLLRIALVGCGLISDEHISAYQQHADRAQITVCCDIDLDKATQKAAVIGNARATTDYESILADPDIDAIELCTPPHLHPDAVIAAVNAGKHVLCQKPLARTLEECDAMIAAAHAAGVVLYYGETHHTMPTAMTAKQAIAEGRIGKIVGIQATFAFWQGGRILSTAWRYDPSVAGGGQLLDSGIHPLDLMRNIGGPIQSVSAFTAQFRPELGGDDTAVVNLRYQEGHVGTLFCSQSVSMWGPAPEFIAHGTEGTLTIGGHRGPLVLHRHDLPDRHEVLLKERTNPFVAMAGHYLDTVLNGAPNPSPGEVGRENLRIVLAAYKSAQLGRTVDLDEIG